MARFTKGAGETVSEKSPVSLRVARDLRCGVRCGVRSVRSSSALGAKPSAAGDVDRYAARRRKHRSSARKKVSRAALVAVTSRAGWPASRFSKSSPIFAALSTFLLGATKEENVILLLSRLDGKGKRPKAHFVPQVSLDSWRRGPLRIPLRYGYLSPPLPLSFLSLSLLMPFLPGVKAHLERESLFWGCCTFR